MSRPLRRTLFVLAASLLFASAADAAMKLQSAEKISFFATGSPGFLDIEGVTKTVYVADDGAKLTFTVPMSSVKTGIDMRDEHMNNEYVQVAQFPNAVLSFDRAALTWPTAEGQKTKGKVKGDFNIHGQSQPVTVEYNLARAGQTVHVDAKFNFDTAKSGIAIPDYLGVTVDSAMNAKVDLVLSDAP